MVKYFEFQWQIQWSQWSWFQGKMSVYWQAPVRNENLFDKKTETEEKRKHKRAPRVASEKVGELMPQRWAGGQPGRREWAEGRKEREVMTGYFSPFALLTADVISHPPRTRSRSNLRLLWTAVLKARNQMKTFITRTLHRLHTQTHTDWRTDKRTADRVDWLSSAARRYESGGTSSPNRDCVYTHSSAGLSSHSIFS